MLFNSYLFVLAFLPAVLVSFYALPAQRARLLLVVGASYAFYAHASWWFPLLMVGSTAISFTGGLVVARLPQGRGRSLTVAAAVAGTLSLLLVFKYAGFVSGYLTSVVSTLTAQGLPGLEEFTRGILLPAGISFYTFEGISYVVDVHRGTIAAERNPLRYAFFISFFPHLIAGPIVRYGKLAPQLTVLARFDVERLRSGLMLFSLGLGKKVLLADGIAARIDPLYNDPSSLGAADAWLALVGYSLQIYFDFSGYSDMALGLARMLGIELPWNFDRPYRSADPGEFWRRWHVTLSSWLRDYLYIPLGGNRKGEVRRDANVLATMGLGGLWHGASLNFVAWGLYHGVLLVARHRTGGRLAWVPRPVAVAGTFLLVSLGWVLFRLHLPADIVSMLAALAGMHGTGSLVGGLLPYLAVGCVIAFGLPEGWRFRLESWGPVRVAAVAAVLGVVLVSLDGAKPFLYFRF